MLSQVKLSQAQWKSSQKSHDEAVEAAEVIEAAEVLRPGKPLLRTSESSRHLNPALFLCFEKKVFLSRIMNYHIEFLHLFCLFHFILAFKFSFIFMF